MNIFERIKRLFAAPVVDGARRLEIVKFAIETTFRLAAHLDRPMLHTPTIVYERRRDGAVGSYRDGVPGMIVIDLRFAARQPLPDVLETIEHELAHAFCAQVYGAALPDHDHRFMDMLALIRGT